MDLTNYIYDGRVVLQERLYVPAGSTLISQKYGYDRRGRQTTNSQPGKVIEQTLDASGVILAETQVEGLLQGLSVSHGYDQFLRRTNLLLLDSFSQTLAQTTNSFDNAGRLKVVGSGAAKATYSYLANSPLVEQIAFTNNGVQRMVTTKQYDSLNRLTSISSVPSGASAVSFNYSYNSANQRAAVTNADNSRWAFGYDSLGQVASGKKYWSDGTAVAGEQFEYSFDSIGNRKTASVGGDQYGGGLRRADYAANALNQYTSRTVPSYVDVIGTANSSATVSLWGDNGSWSPTSRKGGFFRGELSANNTTGAVLLTITNVGVLASGNTDIVTNTVGKALVPASPESFSYDWDGNLLSDGRFSYAWDGENRLVAVTNLSSLPALSRKALTFTYDVLSRRTSTTVYTNNGSAFVPSYTNYFVYDGWNLVAVLGPQSTVLQSFNWGNDVSGSLQGAGGVGGLLSMKVHSGANAGTYFYCYDGNGNVMALVNAADGTVNAQYECGPFGEVLRATGPMATANPFRFSTKFQDDETDIVMYPRRPYNLATGRFLCQDPLGDEAYFTFYTEGKTRFERRQLQEEALKPLYVFVRNDPIGKVDPLGLFFYPRVGTAYQAKEPFGHAAIEVCGTGYGFGPVDTSANPFWTPGTTEGWGPESVGTPRYEWPQYINRSTDRSLWTGKALVPCRCATCADVKACAELVKKRYEHAHYSFPFRTCRDYVHDIAWECCLTGFSRSNAP